MYYSIRFHFGQLAGSDTVLAEVWGKKCFWT